MTRQTLTSQDHQRVTRAIQAAEETTSGEIICVVAHRSDSYFFPAAFIVTVGMLAISLLAAIMLDALWLSLPLWQFAAAQCLALVLALVLIAALPTIRIHFVPRSMRYARAHRNAVSQFLARNIHVTQQRTGVLVFLSLAERYGEIIADSAINEHVSQDQWDAIVAELIAHASRGEIASGFEAAISAAGKLLAGKFPPGAINDNELDDHLVEI